MPVFEVPSRLTHRDKATFIRKITRQRHKYEYKVKPNIAPSW